MIRYLAGVIVRAIVELAVVLFVFAGLLAVVAYRTARLFATPEPDKLDKLAGGLAKTLGFAAGRTRREPDDELEDDELEDDEQSEELDWREQAI